MSLFHSITVALPKGESQGLTAPAWFSNRERKHRWETTESSTTEKADGLMLLKGTLIQYSVPASGH